MRVISIVLIAAALTGCASQPMTPEQRAMMMQFYQQNQANYRAQQQAIQNNRPTNCITNYVGTTAYTTCH